MRAFINIINEAQLSPTVVDDDGDVAHAKWAEFDDEAHVRFWLTSDDEIVIQTMHSSPAIRGRDMLRWLAQYGKPIVVVEATYEALGFWERMQKEGLIHSVDVAEGFPSELENMSVPFNP